jgi:hypothetical protein
VQAADPIVQLAQDEKTDRFNAKSMSASAIEASHRWEPYPQTQSYTIFYTHRPSARSRRREIPARAYDSADPVSSCTDNRKCQSYRQA